MADVTRWDKEYQELLLEYLYGLEKDDLIGLTISYMQNSDVEEALDKIESERGGRYG